MEPSKCYRKNSHIVTTELEDGAILLNLNTKYYYNLNETGLSIWQILDESGDPETITTRLTGMYDIDGKLASIYLDELLEDMEKEGLIVGG